MDRINNFLKRISDSIPKEEGFLDYFNKHFAEATSWAALYSFIQFTCVKRAFDSSETLCEVLNRFGIINNDICEQELIYKNGYHPQIIIDDCCKILSEMGVTTPNVEVVLLDNPLIHHAE